MQVRKIVAPLSLITILLLAGCTQPIVLDAPATTAPAESEAAATESPAEEAEAAAPAAGFPLTVDNCGLTLTYDAPPTRAVTMNQTSTEIMLALGLEGSMVGTAYLDDEILPEYADAYATVPVLADEYPSQEVLLAAEPDFVYAAYGSAFADDAAGSRVSLDEMGIGSYLQVTSCEDRALRPDDTTFETVFDEILTIGAIFGVSDRAEALVAQQQAELDDTLATIGDDLVAYPTLWYDSGTDDVFAGACCGAPNMIMDAAGLVNAFPELEGNWQTISWEVVIDATPEVIVLVDASWDTADQKKEMLAQESLSTISAVQNDMLPILPFSATSLGVRNVSAVHDLAAQLYPDKFQ